MHTHDPQPTSRRRGIDFTSFDARLLAVVALILLTAAVGFGQNVAQISGVVHDPTGAVLPKSEVKATQTDTGIVHTTVTDAAGAYVIPQLPAGPYQLQVSSAGFKSYMQTGLVLQVNASPVINVTLEVGAVSDKVDVTADAAMVETTNAGVGQVIDNQRVLELPLNGRQVTDLVLLGGGAILTLNGGVGSGFVSNRNYPTVAISIAGGSPGGTLYTLDGGSHNDPGTNTNLPVPFPDALQEFKMETSALPARYGQHASAAVTLITKSGTNSLHGDLFEFFRNGDLNARNTFALRRDTLKRNQFGGIIGGPIKKNKIFFFGGYQGTVNHSDPSTTIAFVPTAQMLQGDFSTIAGPTCTANKTTIQLKDPITGVPYTNNQIPVGTFDSVAVKYLKYVPVSTNPCGQFQYGVPAPSDENQALAKLDYQISDKHSVFGRYYFSRYNLPTEYDGHNGLETSVNGQLDQDQSMVFGDTYIVSSSIVQNFHATLIRELAYRLASAFVSAGDLGANITVQTPNYSDMAVSNAFAFGGGGASLAHYNYTNYQFADDVDIVRGAHQIAIGVNYLHVIQNALNSQYMNSTMTFNGSRTGLSMADFLLGATSAFSQGGAVEDVERQNYFSPYIQDVWKVNSRLTINAGIRWEPFFPLYTRFNHVNRFLMSNFLAGTKSTVWTNAPAGMVYPGDPGSPGNRWTDGRLNDFAPRVAVSYDPRGKGKEVIRAAYGIFYDSSSAFFFTLGAGSAPFGSATSLVNVSLSNPWASYPGGNPFPVTLGKNVAFPIPGTYYDAPSGTKPPSMQQWNLSFQKQIGQDWSITATYLGNKTSHSWLGTQLNPAVYIPGSSTTGNTNQRRVLFLLNPFIGQYYGSITLLDAGGNAEYNAAMLNVQKRLSRDFSILTNYTWSHCISDGDPLQLLFVSYQDPNNRNGDRATCLTDRRHVLNTTAVFSSPKFSNHALSLVASGWQLSGIFKAFSGLPINITSTLDTALTGQGSQRPNINGSAALSNPTASLWFNTSPSIFTLPSTGQYGNLGRNALTGPGAWDFDISLVRKFTILESRTFEVRAEGFNVLNHAQLLNPNGSLQSALFGKITTASDPRILQLAMKFVF